MTLSIVPIRSENTTSASWRPASTVIISELGLVYFLLKTEPRKMVKVLLVSECFWESEVIIPPVHFRPRAKLLPLFDWWSVKRIVEDAPGWKLDLDIWLHCFYILGNGADRLHSDLPVLSSDLKDLAYEERILPKSLRVSLPLLLPSSK